MSDIESKITLKLGLIVSLISAMVIFVLTNLWMHQTDITILKTNQAMVLQALADLKTVPTKLAEMNIVLHNLDKGLQEHRTVFQSQIKKEKETLKGR